MFQTPHLVNLNEDPLMSECLLYYIKEGVTRSVVGSPVTSVAMAMMVFTLAEFRVQFLTQL